MEKRIYDMVKQILRSPIFRSQSLEEQTNTLDKIIATGEITQPELFFLINEQLQTDSLRDNFNSVDYNTFITIVMSGKIRGPKLLALCNSSRKLNEYCNKGLQVRNIEGNVAGPTEDQYLFRLLLNEMKAKIPFGRTPRQAYTDRVVGGKVYVFGRNGDGYLLGLGDQDDRDSPVLNPYLKNIVQINAGAIGSVAIDIKGQVWEFGYDEDEVDQSLETPQILAISPKNVVQYSSKNSHARHALYLDSQGHVWSVGSGENGQLGIAGRNELTHPEMIPTLSNIVQIAAGNTQSLCLDNQGHVWSFGENDFGQLGLGYVPDQEIPVLIPDLDNIVQVAAGGDFCLCIDSQGHVWSFGSNQVGELGLGITKHKTIPTMIPNLENIIQISTGFSHSLCLDNQGRVWGFGSNNFGQLGLGVETRRREYVKGPNSPTLIPNLNGIIQVSCGSQHSLCLYVGGQVIAFGSNAHGQLGIQDNVNNPIVVPNLTGVFQISAEYEFSLCLARP